jgi:hypothetical protein
MGATQAYGPELVVSYFLRKDSEARHIFCFVGVRLFTLEWEWDL